MVDLPDEDYNDFDLNRYIYVIMTTEEQNSKWLKYLLSKSIYSKLWRANNRDWNRKYMRKYMNAYYYLHKDEINARSRLKYKQSKTQVVP